jgi:hypothetical protein
MYPVLNFNLLKRLSCFGNRQQAGFVFTNKNPGLCAKLIL